MTIPITDAKAIEEVYAKGGILSADYREDVVIFTLPLHAKKMPKDKPFPKPEL